MPEEIKPATTAEDARTADSADGGWSVESHSAPTTDPPDDTTADAVAAQPPASPAEDDADPDEGESIESGTPTKRAEAVTPAGAKPKKKKQTFQERIDELTGKNGQATRDLATERARTADLQRRIEALERGTSPAPTPAAPQRPADASASLELPDHPKYADFETDDDFNKAVAEWRTKTHEVIVARERRLKDEITGSLDQRLQTEKQGAAVMARQAALQERFATMRKAHPEFDQLVRENADTFKEISSPFVQDMIQNTGDGAELLFDLASSTELALALGALPMPTRPMADAIRDSSASRLLLKHFATEEGRDDFARLRMLPPIAVIREIGKLEARLETAHSGPAPTAVHPITNAAPPAKPPVGTPRAREQSPSSGAPSGRFDDWMAEEDKRERDTRLRAAGLQVPA